MPVFDEDREVSNIMDYYQLGDMLGEGSFGTVRIARHKGTNTVCAIKIIDKVKIASGKDSKQYFDLLKSEIDIIQNMHHQNIVRIMQLVED